MIAGTTVVVYNNVYNPPFYEAHRYINQDLMPVPEKELKRLEKAQVPTGLQQTCFENEYCNCPRYNGSYEQCTNNYTPDPDQNNCPCNNRWFELCPWPFKIYESKYREKQDRHTEDNFKTTPHQPLDQLYMEGPKTLEVDTNLSIADGKETAPFAIPPANVRAF